MDDLELKQIVNDYIKEICHDSQMQVFATSSYQKNYFQLQIDDLINDLINFIQTYIEQTIEDQTRFMKELPQEPHWQEQIRTKQQESGLSDAALEDRDGQRTFTIQELAYYDGSGGKPAYTAVNGIVYDMTNLIRWAGGTHFGLYAGRDFTEAFMNCHQGMTEILAKVPRVGILQQ